MSIYPPVNFSVRNDQIFDDLTIKKNLVIQGNLIINPTGSVVLQDATTFIVNQSDATKRLGFNNFSATSGTTTVLATSQTANRVVTLPDISGTVIVDSGAQTLTGAKTFISLTTFGNAIATSIGYATISGDIGALFNTNSFIKANGTPGAWSLRGIQAGVGGQVMQVYNNTGANMTVTNQDGGASAGNRISTNTGASVVYAQGSTAAFVYDLSTSSWLLLVFS